MKKLSLLTITIATAATICLAKPAMSLTFNFASPGFSNLSASEVFTEGSGFVAVDAFSLQDDGSGGAVYTQVGTNLTQSEFGLGVNAPLDGLVTPQEPAQIDNILLVELVRFTFSDPLVATGAVLSLTLDVADYIFWENDSGVLPTWPGTALDPGVPTLNGDTIASGAVDGAAVVTLPATQSFLFLAANRLVDGPNDGFSIFSIDAAPVPVPAALPMLLAATGGFAWIGYKRKARA